jgi:hypothetical protein
VINTLLSTSVLALLLLTLIGFEDQNLALTRILVLLTASGLTLQFLNMIGVEWTAQRIALLHVLLFGLSLGSSLRHRDQRSTFQSQRRIFSRVFNVPLTLISGLVLLGRLTAPGQRSFS